MKTPSASPIRSLISWRPLEALMAWVCPDPLLGLESRIYLHSAFWTGLFGLAMIVLNSGPEWPPVHTAILVGFSLVSAGFFSLARWGGRFLPFSFILVIVLMTSALWVCNQGALGSISFYYIAPILYAFLLLRGRRRYASLGLSLAVITAGFVLDAGLPSWTSGLFRYPSRTFAIADMYVGLVSAILILAITMRVLVKNFDVERSLTDEKIRQLSYQATTDSLTKLSNRAYVKDRLNEYVARAEAGEGFFFSVLLADIDHFKEVNDRYGHLAGDEVLRAVANTFRQVVRKTDDTGRYGGEEFIVLLPLTTVDEAVMLAEKIRVRLMSSDFGFRPGFTLTASFGVAGHRAGEGLNELVGRADEGLYRAKAEGRNRVVAGVDRAPGGGEGEENRRTDRTQEPADTGK